MGINKAKFFKMRAELNGMKTSTMTKLKELEEENRWLRQMYVEKKG
jgi:putative transposase